MRTDAENCVFCSILRGETPADFVYRDRRVAVFLDRRPLFPGHVLVVPVEHYETLAELPEPLVATLFSVVKAAATAMETALGADGSFVAQNNRVSQSVPHVHVHVVPRNFHDGLRHFFWPRSSYESDESKSRVMELLGDALDAALGGGAD